MVCKSDHDERSVLICCELNSNQADLPRIKPQGDPQIRARPPRLLRRRGTD